MGRLKLPLLLALTTLLSLFSLVGSASACGWLHYQPRPPLE
ncbi:MAG: AgrD family cyclic lactone autoinducer peptide [Bacillota bacterium]